MELVEWWNNLSPEKRMYVVGRCNDLPSQIELEFGELDTSFRDSLQINFTSLRNRIKEVF